MLTLHFFLRNAESAQPHEKCVIYCQLEIEGEKRHTAFSTKIKLPKKYWNAGYIDPSYLLADVITRNLQQIERSFHDVYDILPILYPNEQITYRLIQKTYESRDTSKPTKPKPTAVAVMAEYIQYKRDVDKVAGSTLNTYRTRSQNLMQWFAAEKLTAIKIDEINYHHFESAKKWLQNNPVIGLDHMNKHLTLLKSTVEYALKKRYITSMPVSNLNLKYSKIKPPKYITESLRRNIYNCQMPACETVRDISIFLMHTGFSYVDYCGLRSEHLKDEFFKKRRQKSDIFSLPPLLPEALEIINKYGSIENLPRPDISDLNKELKYLGNICNIQKSTVGFTLSTSVFRETFSSMMENEYMLENRIIMYMMGHTNPKQLNSYSQVLPNRIRHDMGIPVQKKTLDVNYLKG